MESIGRDGVAWSVRLFVTFVSPVKTDRDAVLGLTHVGPRNHVLDRVEIRPRAGANFGVCPAHCKALRVCCDVRSKRDHIVINN